MTQTADWFRRQPAAQARVRLICFHHAGGNAQKFLAWNKILPDWIDACPVHLPGRGARFMEPAHTAMASLVADLAPALAPLCDRPVALLGHSMGASIAFAVAHAMTPHPVHLFAVAARPPGSIRPRIMHRADDAGLLDYLRDLEGTPDLLLQDAEMQALMLPVLRADLTLTETYNERTPLADVPITALGGIADAAVSPDDVDRWRVLTRAPFRRVMLPGNHFFLQAATADVLHLVTETLADFAP
jgi:surfactin synthase thioesterase subunit